MDKVNLYHGDCLTEHEHIEDGSVDLILTDLPYGTVKNAPKNWTVGNESSHEWDMAIEPEDVYEIADRILRKNGKLILFSQEPYSNNLINKATSNIPFDYRMMWEKDTFANPLLANKSPLNHFEEILMFSKTEGYVDNPIKQYIQLVRKYIGKNNKLIYDDFEKRGYPRYSVLDIFNSPEARRCRLPTLETYNRLIELYNIDNMENFIKHEDLSQQYKVFMQKFQSTFNLPIGKKYKSDIFKYKKDYTGYHPTQKPILLLEDLIKTFSNEDDLIVDLTMGSGSTGVACVNTSRRFTGIEMDAKYFNIAKERIEGAENKDQSDIFDFL